MTAWRTAGFVTVGHIVFRKCYGSHTRYLDTAMNAPVCWRRTDWHSPAMPDVLDLPYSGNRLHPTQKPVEP